MFQSQSFPGPWHQIPQINASPVTVSHTGAPSPTSVSHVGDGSTNYTIHVDNPHSAAASHVGGTTLITTSHINVTSPTSIHHVGDESPTSACHVESMSSAVVSDAGGIENSRHLRRKPKFLCRTCKGYHFTCLCLSTTEIPEEWGSPKGPSDYEASVVSPHLVSPFIDTVVILSQSSPDLTPVVEGDVSHITVTMHPLQPIIEEVVVLVQYLVNPTLLVGSDVSFNHVVNIPDPTPSERESVLLSPSPLPLSFEEITFDWDGPVGYPMPPPMSFPVRDII
jgi:hypothetical protein